MREEAIKKFVTLLCRTGWALFRDQNQIIADINEAVMKENRETATKLSTTCERCGTKLDGDGHCEDITCPFHDVTQDNPAGWIGHFEAPKADYSELYDYLIDS